MKACIFALALMLSTAAYGQTAPPAKPVDLSGLSRADLETLCRNLYDRVNELHDELAGSQLCLKKLHSDYVALQVRFQEMTERESNMESRIAATMPPPAASEDPQAVHLKLKRLIDAGEVLRKSIIDTCAKEITQRRSELAELENPPVSDGELDSCSKTVRRLSDLKGCIPCISSYAVDEVGEVGCLGTVTVVQVVDKDNMIIAHPMAWVEGIDTTGMVDGQNYPINRVVEIDSTTQYTTANRTSNTVLKITPMNVDEWIEPGVNVAEWVGSGRMVTLNVLKPNHP